MKVTGRCHCGDISLTAEVDPQTSGLCHCTDCQTFSGPAFRTAVQARAETVRFSGTPSRYIKVAESGTRRMQGFCGRCGTALFSCAPENATVYALRVPILAERASLPPQRQIWCDSSVQWLDALGTLPRVARQTA